MRKRGVEGPQAAEEERKKEEPEVRKAAQEVKNEEKNKGKASTEEEEDPADQVLKAIRACIEESFKEAETPYDVLISIKDESDCNELSLLFNKMNFNFAYWFDVFPDGSIH
ncbi:hypothetical protein JCGZ_03529 [Jatropha curcas]|uniref:Uncharacterized protein n=1 Tax=Jatropha curcas TaxID=180498 RepID=A0A067LC16_JATCU|nr:hypothetical protein JCGZ_03529 [Jatropha curcas]